MQTDRVNLLRNQLLTLGLDGFIIPSNDDYLGEYAAHDSKRLEWLTGFSGSNGVAVLLHKKAAFFTDGRYLLQASMQLDQSIWQIYDMYETNIFAWIAENTDKHNKIAFDPWLHRESQVMKLQAINHIETVALSTNPIDSIWHDRPVRELSGIRPHPLKYSGENSLYKRIKLVKTINTHNAKALIITNPESICWLLNIRGNDVSYNQNILSRAILHQDATLEFFVNNLAVSNELKAHLGGDISIQHLSDMENSLNYFANKKIIIDANSSPYWFMHHLQKINAEVISIDDPCVLLKACKNKTEIEGAIEAHIQDGIALCSLLHFLDENLGKQKLDEITLAEKLLEFRAKQPDFLTASFDTIAGFASNGAIIHYRASEATNKDITGDNLLLIDSGGQYHGGTTDVTRTISTGKATERQKELFTRVLKGHIALATSKFPVGTTGAQLDVLARQYLWQIFYDYPHGTGHGVGSCLSVHEGPQSISKRSEQSLLPGMILSNEPGYYNEGEFGIRIENLLLVTGDDSFLSFKNLTKAPIDKKLLAMELLTEGEINYLNEYHQDVYNSLSKRIDDKKLLSWLEKATKKLVID